MIIPLTYTIQIKIIFKEHKRRNEKATKIPICIPGSRNDPITSCVVSQILKFTPIEKAYQVTKVANPGHFYHAAQLALREGQVQLVQQTATEYLLPSTAPGAVCLLRSLQLTSRGRPVHRIKAQPLTREKEGCLTPLNWPRAAFKEKTL